MKFAVETWAPEYGISSDESQLEDASTPADISVEVSPQSWRPLDPAPGETPTSVLFVDGVRRIDARVWIAVDDGSAAVAGVCATVAAGAVRCTADSATVVDQQILRGVFAPACDEADDIVTHLPGVSYTFFPSATGTPEDLYLEIHNAMTSLETDLSRSAATDDAELLVFDGPLRNRSDPRGVGYVKTQHVQYVPDPQLPVLASLGNGQRTPLFLLGGRGGSRYSWYLRLPADRTQPWAGIVRCEINAIGSVADATARADQITALLPRYASEPHKDGRAPQNLYPIAGLEHALRRRLGDPLLIERALRIAAVP